MTDAQEQQPPQETNVPQADEPLEGSVNGPNDPPEDVRQQPGKSEFSEAIRRHVVESLASPSSETSKSTFFPDRPNRFDAAAGRPFPSGSKAAAVPKADDPMEMEKARQLAIADEQRNIRQALERQAEADADALPLPEEETTEDAIDRMVDDGFIDLRSDRSTPPPPRPFSGASVGSVFGGQVLPGATIEPEAAQPAIEVEVEEDPEPIPVTQGNRHLVNNSRLTQPE